MKDDELREFINELTATAVKHKDCQSMREAIAHVVKAKLRPKTRYSLCHLHGGVGFVNDCRQCLEEIGSK